MDTQRTASTATTTPDAGVALTTAQLTQLPVDAHGKFNSPMCGSIIALIAMIGLVLNMFFGFSIS
jgi:hypothetical protein